MNLVTLMKYLKKNNASCRKPATVQANTEWRDISLKGVSTVRQELGLSFKVCPYNSRRGIIT